MLDTGNPYRYLFPIGCLNAILGAALWLAFQRGWVDIYPAPIHANLMIGGFLLAFAVGFLWTAIPRFLQAPPAGPGELGTLISVLGATPVLGVFPNPTLFYLAALSALLLTMRFGRRRYLLRRADPPPSFLFVFAGISLAAVSLAVLVLHAYLPLPDLAVACARNFFLKGFLLCLVLGIGMKLLPALLGWAPLPTAGAGGNQRWLDYPNLAILVYLLTGIFLESNGSVRAAGVALSAAMLTAGLGHLHLGQLPRARSGLGYSIWLSGWIFALAPATLVLAPGYVVHFWHFIFIGGFGLLTLAVSARVVLAHSGQEFLVWEKRVPLFVIAALVLLAMLTRVSAPFLDPERLLSHYAYAAGTWILALLGWFYYFVKFTWLQRHGGEDGERC